jgi:AraC-like DNA-binding protein
MNENGQLIEMLTRSEIFQNHRRAYTAATGMPVTLRPVTTWQLSFHGKGAGNAFCAVMAGKSPTCAACLRSQAKLAQDAMDEPATRTCAYGLRETAVPVKLGPQTIGFLQTGHMMRRKPTRTSFQRAVDQAAKLGADIGNEQARRAFFETPVASPGKLAAATVLLGIFADHLALLSNQLLMQAAHRERPAIIRAKQFIREHYMEHLSLRQISSIAIMSPFHFSKLFRKDAGLGFTEFISRTRIEKAKNFLLNPNLRISEIGFETGFQSLTHFNRVFRKIAGQSPTEYRGRLSTAPGGRLADSAPARLATGPGNEALELRKIITPLRKNHRLGAGRPEPDERRRGESAAVGDSAGPGSANPLWVKDRIAAATSSSL